MCLCVFACLCVCVRERERERERERVICLAHISRRLMGSLWDCTRAGVRVCVRPHFQTAALRDLHRRAAYSICESWFLIHQDVYHDLFVLDELLTS